MNRTCCIVIPRTSSILRTVATKLMMHWLYRTFSLHFPLFCARVKSIDHRRAHSHSSNADRDQWTRFCKIPLSNPSKLTKPLLSCEVHGLWTCSYIIYIYLIHWSIPLYASVPPLSLYNPRVPAMVGSRHPPIEWALRFILTDKYAKEKKEEAQKQFITQSWKLVLAWQFLPVRDVRSPSTR